MNRQLRFTDTNRGNLIMEATVEKLENGRTILLIDGKPALVELVMRESETPARVKAALVIKTVDDDGVSLTPLPFAEPIMGANGYKPNGYTPDFRLEMN